MDIVKGVETLGDKVVTTKRSFIPALVIGFLVAIGIRHARKTGNCLCGDIVKEITGKRPSGAK